MSDTEQNKKRKIDEVEEGSSSAEAPAVAPAAPAPPAEAAAAAPAAPAAPVAPAAPAPAATPIGPTSAPAAAPPADNIDVTLQIAKEKQRVVKLLEPFSRDQLIAILSSAASQYSNIFDEIKAMASTDVAHRKIFVRGLAWETTSDTLKDAFSGFGAVDEAAVIYDKATNKSKGYGFVTFSDMEAAQRAVEQQHVDINGRRATCNLAALRANAEEQHSSGASQSHRGPGPSHAMYGAPGGGSMYAPPAPHAVGGGGYSDEAERKLFVRGLSWNTTDDMFYAEFVKYGELEEAMIARDRATGKSKGFGFITYKHKASADLALQQPQKIIDGRTTTCNLASQGGARASGGGMGYGGGMAPVMPAAVPAYGMPMYAAMPGQYGVPAPQMQQAAPVQYGAYAGMADPYAQSYGAVPAAAAQYYQGRAPGQPAPAPQR